ncbi:MAG: DUF4383 domain-containing protein [Deltaproteobacteria bacterium]|nr:DUF4383 domain-containing protein [Deltaproteobacteria bacterium]
MTMRGQCKFFGWALLAIGILGFVPRITMAGYLFGMFHVNAALNLVHMITGAALLWASLQTECASMRTFQVSGIVYTLFGLIGLTNLGAAMVGPFAIGAMVTLLHLVLAAIWLFIGFFEPMRHPVKCSV